MRLWGETLKRSLVYRYITWHVKKQMSLLKKTLTPSRTNRHLSQRSSSQPTHCFLWNLRPSGVSLCVVRIASLPCSRLLLSKSFQYDYRERTCWSWLLVRMSPCSTYILCSITDRRALLNTVPHCRATSVTEWIWHCASNNLSQLLNPIGFNRLNTHTASFPSYRHRWRGWGWLVWMANSRRIVTPTKHNSAETCNRLFKPSKV